MDENTKSQAQDQETMVIDSEFLGAGISPQRIRQTIESVEPRRMRTAFKFQYLAGARASEVCGAYAIQSRDYLLSEFMGKPIAVFKIKTAKRSGRPRYLGLPREKSLEPWTEEIIDHLKSRPAGSQAWPFTTRTLQNYGAEFLKGLEYQIESYRTKAKVLVKDHKRSVTTHGLRHLRSTELMLLYGFDEIDLRTYMGWTMGRLGGSMARYVYMQFSRYLPKLLRIQVSQEDVLRYLQSLETNKLGPQAQNLVSTASPGLGGLGSLPLGD